MRSIRTAHYFQAINEAAIAGNDLKIYKVDHSDYENFDFCIYQNLDTLALELVSDKEVANKYASNSNYKLLLDWNKYYPFIPKTPILAYVLPKDLTVGEEVLLEEVITETGIGEKNKAAKWNGSEFELLA